MDIFETFLVPLQNLIFISIALVSWALGWRYLGRELLAAVGPKVRPTLHVLLAIFVAWSGFAVYVKLVAETVLGVDAGWLITIVITLVVLVVTYLVSAATPPDEPEELAEANGIIVPSAGDRTTEFISVAMLVFGALGTLYVLSIR
jgi:hypothetical protein